MKRNLTFELKKICPDWNIKIPKDLEKRIGSHFKLLGDIIVGNKLDMCFEDGFTYKTSELALQGYINTKDDDDNVVFVTLCTKDLCYEMDVINKKIKVKIEEQIKISL